MALFSFFIFFGHVKNEVIELVIVQDVGLQAMLVHGVLVLEIVMVALLFATNVQNVDIHSNINNLLSEDSIIFYELWDL